MIRSAGPVSLCMAALSLAAESAGADQEPAPKSWGVYQIHWNDDQFRLGLDQQLSLLGGHPAYVLDFRDLNATRGFPAGVVRIAADHHLIPIISLELWTWGPRKNGNDLLKIALGDYDDFFTRWAKDAASWSHPLILRFGFEMNGDWFPWGQKPEMYQSAWKRAHAIFVREHADQVKWMFAPNVIYGEQTAKTGIEAYYPGDDQVDLIGVDGYSFGDHHDCWHCWRSYQDVFGPTITALARYSKPLIISEVGCADDERKPAWIHDFLSAVSQDPHVSSFVWFNLDKRGEGEPDWRVQSDPASLAVFTSWAARAARIP